MAVRPFDEIFRDFVTDGIPTSGPHHPYKPDIRDSLNAIVRGAFPDNRVIKLNNANEGTANEIVVSASVDIPTAVYQVLYVLNVTQENTGPVTVSGAINRKLVTNTSEPIPAGYLKPGMAVLCIDTGSELRMLSYGDVESSVEELVRQAEAALADAEQAKDQAQNAASDAVSQGNVPIYSTLESIASLEIPAGINAIRVNGRNSVGDGQGGLYVASDNGSTDTGMSGDGRTWYRVISEFINVKWFGAKGDGISDDTLAFKKSVEASSLFGVEIRVPRGNFLIKDEIRLDSGTTIKGVDRYFSIIEASVDLPPEKNLITTSNNTGEEHNNYVFAITVKDLTIDGKGHDRALEPDWDKITNGNGCNIKICTTEDFIIENVTSKNGFLHCIDVSASKYINTGNVNDQPKGMSYDGIIRNCRAIDPFYDDAITTHNSGRILISKCQSLYNRATKLPNEWQYGVELDEGSFDITVADCYASGFFRGFAAKGHPTTHGAQHIQFNNCVSHENTQGFWLYHHAGYGTPNNFAISMRDCTISSPIPHPEWDRLNYEGQLFQIAQTGGVTIDGLKLSNIGDAFGHITGEYTGKVSISNVFIDGEILPRSDGIGIFAILGTMTNTMTHISNVDSRQTSPRPIVYNPRGAADNNLHIVENVRVRGSDATKAPIYLGNSRASSHIVRGVIAQGWGGVVYDINTSVLLGNNLSIEQGAKMTMTIASGSPEGLVRARNGTLCWGQASGNLFKKHSGIDGGNDGWVQIV